MRCQYLVATRQGSIARPPGHYPHYARIKEGLGPERPDGLIAHLAWRTQTGLRYVDAWQSKDAHEAFAEHRLHPVVHPLLQDMLGFVPPEPAHTVLDLIDAWTERHPG